MRCYAGIGSREISDDERTEIIRVASALGSDGWVCYSGNTAGADVAFQLGSAGRCVIFLPWLGFNFSVYNAAHHSLALFVAGQSKRGLRAISQYHPAPHVLTASARMLMARNYHQVMGYETTPQSWPRVEFILCCATVVDDQVQGGTGQACRIAIDQKIPIINIRYPGWKEKLEIVIAKVRQEENKS
jgi:hypothetical protein